MNRSLPVVLALVVLPALAACGGGEKIGTFTVPDDAMSPAYAKGEKVAIHEVDVADLRAGDAVVLTEPWTLMEVGKKRPDVLRRVIGFQGDNVACDPDKVGGKVTVNGEVVDESYLAKDADPCPHPFDVIIPHDRIWLLADNRGQGTDSSTPQNDDSSTWVDVDLVKGLVHADGK